MNKNLILSIFLGFGIASSPTLYAKSDDSDSRASSPKQRSDNKQVNKQVNKQNNIQDNIQKIKPEITIDTLNIETDNIIEEYLLISIN